MAEPHSAGPFSLAASPERARIREAMMETVVESGHDGATAAAVSERAGVDLATFERHFSDVADCRMQIYLANLAEYDRTVSPVAAAPAPWRDRMRAVAYATARYIRDRPLETRFDMVQMLVGGELAAAHRDHYVKWLVDLIDAGRQELDDPDSIGRGVAEGVFGSIHESIARDLQAGAGTRAAEDFVPDLMYIAVRPYLGHEAAREELTIPPPPEAGGAPSGAVIQPSTEMRHDVTAADPSRYGQSVSEEGGRGDDAALRLARLPPGRHGLPREFVTQNQRDRLAAGIISVVAERGFNAATITQICAAAGVSRRTFYVYFSSKEECFFAAYGTIAKHMRIATDAAAADHDEWPQQVAAKLRVSLEFFAANPDLARFCLVAPQRAGEEVAARYRETMNQAVGYLCEGMPPPLATKAPSEAVAGSLMGGMAALVVRKVEAGEGDDLPALQADLVELFLTPYLGRAEASKVAQSPL
jgi:AcrR family transcriptional regulator